MGYFLVGKMEKFPHPDGKKNNFSWTNSETKILLKLKKDRGAEGSKHLF
jgi:hypothetical protein